jgi:hypothetical protein
VAIVYESRSRFKDKIPSAAWAGNLSGGIIVWTPTSSSVWYWSFSPWDFASFSGKRTRINKE